MKRNSKQVAVYLVPVAAFARLRVASCESAAINAADDFNFQESETPEGFVAFADVYGILDQAQAAGVAGSGAQRKGVA